MSLEAALQAHTEAVQKNTAALATLQAAILQALSGKAAANTDAPTTAGTQQTNAGVGENVSSNSNNSAGGGAATGEPAKRGPGRPSNAARAAAAAGQQTGQAASGQAQNTSNAASSQTSGQSQANPNPGNANQEAGAAGVTGAGNESSGEDAELAALLGGSPEPEKQYDMTMLQQLVKDLSLFGQAYARRALAEIKQFQTHNGLVVDMLTKLQAKDFNAFGAKLQAIWTEGNEAAKKAKEPGLVI